VNSKNKLVINNQNQCVGTDLSFLVKLFTWKAIVLYSF